MTAQYDLAKTLAKSIPLYSCEQSYRILLNTATMGTLLPWYGIVNRVVCTVRMLYVICIAGSRAPPFALTVASFQLPCARAPHPRVCEF